MSVGKWTKRKAPEEIAEGMRRQVANMRRSMDAFDNGAYEEAERLASSIYIICHDGGRNEKSLLGQLGLKNLVGFIESRLKPEPDVLIFGPPLLAVDFAGDRPSLCVPAIGPAAIEVPFSKWWKAKVYENAAGLVLSRSNLVHYFRNQDGGGHFDDHLRSEAYYRFTRLGDHVSWNEDRTLSVDTIGAGIDTTRAAEMTIRKIATELQLTLKSSGFWD